MFKILFNVYSSEVDSGELHKNQGFVTGEFDNPMYHNVNEYELS